MPDAAGRARVARGRRSTGHRRHPAGPAGGAGRAARRHGGQGCRDVPQHVARVEAGAVQLERARAQARQVQQLGEQRLHPIRAAADGGQQLLALRGARRQAGIEQHPRARPYRGQRGPQLMADGGQQLCPEPLQLLQPQAEVRIAAHHGSGRAAAECGGHEPWCAVVTGRDPRQPERRGSFEQLVGPLRGHADALFGQCVGNRRRVERFVEQRDDGQHQEIGVCAGHGARIPPFTCRTRSATRLVTAAPEDGTGGPAARRVTPHHSLQEIVTTAMVTTDPTRAEIRTPNAIESALAQFDRAADFLGLAGETRAILRVPKREWTVQLPGDAWTTARTEVLHRLPRPAQHGARPGQGRHPLPSRDGPRRGARAGDVDDLEVRAGRMFRSAAPRAA